MKKLSNVLILLVMLSMLLSACATPTPVKEVGLNRETPEATYDYFKAMARRNGGKWYKVSAKTDFTDLLQMFREMASRVSQVVLDVHEIGEGSVAKYLRLNPPDARQ